MVRRRVQARGRVQGVGFRYSCASEAEARNVTGWVRNLPDGGVEAVFVGAKADVDAMTKWMRAGPSWAHVTSVETTDEPEVDTPAETAPTEQAAAQHEARQREAGQRRFQIRS
jgi:acylphosphatase